MFNGEKLYKTFTMFTATMQPWIEKLARKYLRFPAFVQVGQSKDKKKNIE